MLKEIRMEVKKIEVVKNWSKPKLVHDIQIFLGFANFYWRFIQGFSRIVALLTSMLKTTGLFDKPAFNIINGSKQASRRNNNNGEVDEFGSDGVKHAKKSEKLKSQNSAKC